MFILHSNKIALSDNTVFGVNTKKIGFAVLKTKRFSTMLQKKNVRNYKVDYAVTFIVGLNPNRLISSKSCLNVILHL